MDLEIELYRLLGGTPVFLVLLVGAGLCVYDAPRIPKVCLLTGMALALVLANRVVYPFAMTWFFRSELSNMHDVKMRVLLNAFVLSIPQAIAWGLMLWAAFGTSSRTTQPTPFSTDEDSRPG